MVNVIFRNTHTGELWTLRVNQRDIDVQNHEFGYAFGVLGSANDEFVCVVEQQQRSERIVTMQDLNCED